MEIRCVGLIMNDKKVSPLQMGSATHSFRNVANAGTVRSQRSSVSEAALWFCRYEAYTFRKSACVRK